MAHTLAEKLRDGWLAVDGKVDFTFKSTSSSSPSAKSDWEIMNYLKDDAGVENKHDVREKETQHSVEDDTSDAVPVRDPSHKLSRALSLWKRDKFLADADEDRSTEAGKKMKDKLSEGDIYRIRETDCPSHYRTFSSQLYNLRD